MSDTQATLNVTVLVVGDSGLGGFVQGKIASAGHQVVAVETVGADRLGDRVRELAADDVTHAAVVVGGTPEALRPALDVELEGYAQRFRDEAWAQVGVASMLLRPIAGVTGELVVFSVPANQEGATLGLSLVNPVLPLAVRQQGKTMGATSVGIQQIGGGTAPAPAPKAASTGGTASRAPKGFQLGSGQGMTVVDDDPEADDYVRPASTPEDDDLGLDIPDRGWKRAVHDLNGRVLDRSREDLPINIESLAPVVNVLETSGEQAVLKLKSGARFSLWGWPDLQRPESKVLAVGWGEPLAEVIALHRFPKRHGTVIEERRALVMDQSADVAKVCREVTGAAPPSTDGVLFAVDTDEVWILRGSRVIRWDGRRERDDGSPKQVLATLVLRWSGK